MFDCIITRPTLKVSPSSPERGVPKTPGNAALSLCYSTKIPQCRVFTSIPRYDALSYRSGVLYLRSTHNQKCRRQSLLPGFKEDHSYNRSYSLCEVQEAQPLA